MIVRTEYGLGRVERLYLSELGFVMIRLYIDNDKTYRTWNLGKLNDLEIGLEFILEKFGDRFI